MLTVLFEWTKQLLLLETYLLSPLIKGKKCTEEKHLLVTKAKSSGGNSPSRSSQYCSKFIKNETGHMSFNHLKKEKINKSCILPS